LLKLSFLILLMTADAGSCLASTAAGDYNTDSLRPIYGNHKQFLKEYETASLVALSYYPELVHERIRFRFSGINSTARTTMTFFSLFEKGDRQFIISINRDSARTGVLLHDAPFDAQVAILAHELAHVMDFRRRSFMGMALWGAGYLFVKQRGRIEKRADEMVISRGLGQSLFDWADFVLNHSHASKRYLKMKRTKYLLPDEILKHMEKYQPD
jgi:hypothetical protein